MARPNVAVRAPRPDDPLRTDPYSGAEDHQVAATPLRPFTGSVKSENQDLMNPSTAPIPQCLIRAPRPRWAAVQVETEQNCSPKQGEKLSLQTPISATICSTFPGSEGLEAIAPAMRPGTQPPVEEDNSFSKRGRTSVHEVDDLIQQALEHVLREEREQNRSSASTPAVVDVKLEGVDVKLEGVDVKLEGVHVGTSSGYNQKPRAERIHLPYEDLVSDLHMRLEDKAAKLQVSRSLFKSRRKAAGLGRWPGRAERARIKHAQAQARA